MDKKIVEHAANGVLRNLISALKTGNNKVVVTFTNPDIAPYVASHIIRNSKRIRIQVTDDNKLHAIFK